MTDAGGIEVICFDESYAVAAVDMWRDSKQRAIGIPENHSFNEQLLFLTESLVSNNSVYLSIDRDKGLPVGLLATDGDFLNQLYVHVDYQRKGIGSSLLDLAKQKSNGRLRLYTFECNRGAQRFYEKHGFQLLGGGSDNEEGLPDLLFEWRKAKIDEN